jgi:hypothetical protein
MIPKLLSIVISSPPRRGQNLGTRPKQKKKVSEMVILNYLIECQGKTEAGEATIIICRKASDGQMRRGATLLQAVLEFDHDVLCLPA